MKKVIYRNFLKDCLIFFTIALISGSTIIWVFQAVNYLDIIIDDGRNYLVYLQYSLLNFPKILTRIFPFAFFFSFSYVISKYEIKNELIIFWNNGVKKINFINYFFIVSIFLLLIQIILTTIIVPKSQNLARNLMRTSEFNFVENFIKVKKFNATINNLTIYSEDKDNNESYKNIYIKRKINDKDFQIIFAKKGEFKTNSNNPTLLLYEGENINISNENITNFSFEKSEFNLSPFSSNTILVKKTQEHFTEELIECAINLINKTNLEKIIKKVRNCEVKNLNNILSELYKRLVIPLYLPALMLTLLLLIVYSKEKINYSKKRVLVFLIGFFIIIFSETTLRFVKDSNARNFLIILLPIILSITYYFYYLSILKKN
ncbi:LptF/LptG family permease [Candidatus Pelagibacter sp. HIMB1506]|uniref:LptF/LptG family permease n=1 Tax=Candidatus Pelagibacter sp. HIMB1506 TaxID=3413337 RepID=UPI003F86659F